MFKLDQNPTFWNKVEWQLPGEPPEDFKAKFKVVPLDQLEGDEFTTGEGNAKLLKDIILDVDDIVNASGKPAKFSDDLIDQLLNVPYLRNALLRSYINGVSGAQRGN